MAAAGQQGPGLLFGLGGSGALSQAAQWLFLTSLFAAALAFHNAVWRYMYALGRENVLPAALGRTGGNNIPKAASLAQSVTGLAVIVVYALAGWDPMTQLFFWLGTTGGFGILVLLALTAVAVVAFFARDPRGENAWRRLIAPALAAVLLGGIVVLAALHYATLLGVPPGRRRVGAARQLRRRRGDRAGLGAGAQGPPPADLRRDRARRPRRHRPARPLPAKEHGHDLPPPGWPMPPGDGLHAGVVPADPADLDTLSQVIADAFHDLAPSRWLIADPDARREIFPGYFRIYVEHALASGVVHTTPDRDRRGAVAPHRRGRRQPPAPDYDTRLAGGDRPLDRPVPGLRRRRWTATTRPAPPTTTWPSSPSARTGKARAPAPRCCAPTTPDLDQTPACPPTWKPPTCAPAASTSPRLRRPRPAHLPGRPGVDVPDVENTPMTCSKPRRPGKSRQAGTPEGEMDNSFAGIARHWRAGREVYQWNVLPGTLEARERLISQYRDLADWPGLVLVHADQMHVAVQRIGSVTAITGAEIATISRQIQGRCGGLRPFPVTVGRAEAWEIGVVCPVRPGYLLRFLRQVITDVTQDVTGGLPDLQRQAYYPYLTVTRAVAHLDQRNFRAWMSDCEAAEMTFQVTGLVLTAEQHNCREIRAGSLMRCRSAEVRDQHAGSRVPLYGRSDEEQRRSRGSWCSPGYPAAPNGADDGADEY